MLLAALPTFSALQIPPSYAHGLRANLADHAKELAVSKELGFSRAAVAVQPAAECQSSFRINRTLLGMGRACPFEGDELVFASAPIFTQDECMAVRKEARTLIAGGAQSTFTMTETNRDVALHDMRETLAWLNGGAFARVTSFAADCFPSAVDDATSLWIYRGLGAVCRRLRSPSYWCPYRPSSPLLSFCSS